MKNRMVPPPKVVFFIPLGDSYFDAVGEASETLDFSIFVDMVQPCPDLFGLKNWVQHILAVGEASTTLDFSIFVDMVYLCPDLSIHLVGALDLCPDL